MQIHTSARIEHDPRLLSFVEAATNVIVEAVGRSDGLGFAWETTERNRLSVWMVDRHERVPELRLDGLADDDFAGLREKIRRQMASPSQTGCF